MGSKSRWTSFPDSSSDRGLVGVVIAMGAATVLISALASSIVYTYRQSELIRKKSESGILISDFATVLSDPSLCERSLPMGTVIQQGQTIPITVSLAGDAGHTFQAGALANDRFFVESVNLQVANVPPAQIPYQADGDVDPEPYLRFTGALVVSLSLVDSSSAGNARTNMRPITVPLSMVTDDTNALRHCGSGTLPPVSCANNGGMWKPNGAGGGTCEPLNYCLHMGSYTQDSGFTGAFANAFTGGHNCPSGSLPYVGGMVTEISKSGKYSTRSTPRNIMTCLRCGPEAAKNRTAAVTGVTPSNLWDLGQDESAYKTDYQLAMSSLQTLGPWFNPPPQPPDTCGRPSSSQVCQTPYNPFVGWQCSCAHTYTNASSAPGESCGSGMRWAWTGSYWDCEVVPDCVVSSGGPTPRDSGFVANPPGCDVDRWLASNPVSSPANDYYGPNWDNCEQMNGSKVQFPANGGTYYLCIIWNPSWNWNINPF